MQKSRVLLFAIAGSISVAVFATQVAMPSILAGHVKALTEANTISGTATVQPLGGSPRTVQFVFSKPNYFRIDTEVGFSVCDGKTITHYTKSLNRFTVESTNETNVYTTSASPELWAWSCFFNKDAYRDVTSKIGSKRSLKGMKVTEVMLDWQKGSPGSATLFVDEKSGYAKGFTFKSGETESIVLSEDIALSAEIADPKKFEFVAPSGAEKVETLKPVLSGYASVQQILGRSCMPCHNSQNRKSGIDLSSYESMSSNSGALSPGNPEQSGIYRSTSGARPSMPKNQAPLSASELQTIFDWIKAGAKKD